MVLDDLYRLKGEAITEIEIWQAKLNDVNQKIIAEINKKTEKMPDVHLNGKQDNFLKT